MILTKKEGMAGEAGWIAGTYTHFCPLLSHLSVMHGMSRMKARRRCILYFLPCWIGVIGGHEVLVIMYASRIIS
jgi:hypothetical protein